MKRRQEIKAAIKETAEKHVLKVRKKLKAPWLTNKTTEIVKKRREIKAKGIDKSACQKLNQDFQKQARQAKEAHLHGICNKLEDDSKAGRAKELFKRVKEVTGKFVPKRSGIKNKDGCLLSETVDVKARWKEYVEDLYEKDEQLQDKYVEVEFEKEPDILPSEVEKAIKDISCYKAVGIDGIPIELIKAGGDEAVSTFTILCQKIWLEGS